MFRWVHIAVGLNLTARSLYVVNDDAVTKINLKIDYSKIGVGNKLEVRAGGRFVLGQRLYTPDGGFHILETLDGEIADYRLYDSFLMPNDIKEIMDCRDPPTLRKPIVSLNEDIFEKVGGVELQKVYLDTICSEHTTEFYLFFSEKRNFPDSVSWCRKIKGEIILPQSPELNEKLYHQFLPYREKCQDIWTHLFWLGFNGDLATGTWRNLRDRRPIEWFNFLSQYKTVTNESQCAATVSHDPYKWASCPCGIEVCTLCNFTIHPELRLRGPCKISLLDRTFSFRENDKYDLVFDGVWHTMIMFENNNWVIKSRLYEEITGTMILKRKGEYPVGVHEWKISGDRCTQEKTKFLLTSCNKDQYTCNDGSCIPKDARCDLSVHCIDESDEIDCSVVELPPGYSQRIPPPSVQAEPLPVYISFNVTSIKKFDLSSFSIGIDMLITLMWEDRRLKYKNIRENYRENLVGAQSSVWIPRFKYRDGTLSAAKLDVHSQAIYVKRLTEPMPDDDTTILEDRLYSGQGNTLILEQELTLNFKCYFHLQMYPFDRQVCFMEFILYELTKNLGVLMKDGDGITFTGKRKLLEYKLLSEEYRIYTRDSVSRVRILMEFQNLYGYYIGNTFTPTLMLVVICYSCLLFDVNDFEDRIMVSLTALLVLATFFSQVSQTIPRTAYLKLIDVWFLALITEVFAVIISLVLIEVLRLRNLSSTVVKVAPLNKEKTSKWVTVRSSWLSDPKKLNKALIIFYPVSLFLLLFIFGSVSTYNLFISTWEDH
ncbi:uncharacterized protein [Palaemon carinicauda]|uniref:uncharacterized protein n=1 Tax=Palaemon carinicauda TaxID=392227 RepID=UPI0035B5ED8F